MTPVYPRIHFVANSRFTWQACENWDDVWVCGRFAW
jgi:hypothetical protein